MITSPNRRSKGTSKQKLALKLGVMPIYKKKGEVIDTYLKGTDLFLVF